MTKEEFVESMTYLGIAYGKEYSQIEIQQHYDFLKEFSDEVLMKAIKNIIKKSKFLPKITELIEECENCKELTKYNVIEFMRSKGYFKNVNEYEKTVNFVKRNIVPIWLQEDINKHYKMMKQEEQLLENTSGLLIGG